MNNYRTMKEIGAMLGSLTSHQVGKALKKLGLRTAGGWPTEKALASGLATERATDGTHRLYVWHEQHTVQLLKNFFAPEQAK